MGALVLSSSSLIPSAAATSSYGLVNSFEGSSFFNDFNFASGADPTHGFVFRIIGDLSLENLQN
jgi:hypothetical protein